MSLGGKIAAEGNSSNPLVFELSEFKGRRILDIRKWYKDKSGDLKRTQKGIALTATSFGVLVRMLSEQEQSILEWFNEKDEIGRKRKEIQLVQELRESSKFTMNGYVSDADSWRSPEFFSTEARGATDVLTLNMDHPFVVSYKELASKLEAIDLPLREELEVLVDGLLFSFCKARSLCDSETGSNFDSILDTLVMNWGIALKRYQGSLNGS